MGEGEENKEGEEEPGLTESAREAHVLGGAHADRWGGEARRVCGGSMREIRTISQIDWSLVKVS